jgi:4-hydroxy-tetrahydrodipicolinate synthase
MTLHASTLPQVLSPVVTPFTTSGDPDMPKLAKQCQWLQKNKVGMAVFGTNSEANSMSVSERLAILDHLIGAGLPPSQMMPGTGACAVPDAVTMTNAAVKAGCAGVLLLPPFYYKDVTDDGLFAYVSRIIEKVGSTALKIYVYNIPPITRVSFSLPLLERLVAAYPNTVVGIKDSSGDWAYTESVINTLAPSGFRVYAGSESFLLKTMQAGGAGCISATTNVNPAAIASLARDWQSADAPARQAALDQVRMVFQKRPMIAAMKAAVAHYSGDPQWAELRPPLVKLSAAEHASLLQELSALNFSMPGV